jgi:hypothetical protein
MIIYFPKVDADRHRRMARRLPPPQRQGRYVVSDRNAAGRDRRRIHLKPSKERC